VSTLSSDKITEVKNRYCPCPDCEGACEDVLQEAAEEGARVVIQWIQRNAVYSHSPSRELIRIEDKDWQKLLKAEIPEDKSGWVARCP